MTKPKLLVLRANTFVKFFTGEEGSGVLMLTQVRGPAGQHYGPSRRAALSTLLCAS